MVVVTALEVLNFQSTSIGKVNVYAYGLHPFARGDTPHSKNHSKKNIFALVKLLIIQLYRQKIV